MSTHLEPNWVIKFWMVVYPLYHVWGVGGGIIVTDMTPWKSFIHIQRYFNKYWPKTDFDLDKIVISYFADYLSVPKKKVG